MALTYAQIDFELRDILLNDKPKSLLDYSSKGTVPVLVLPDQVIDESLDIMLWALSQSDKGGWLKEKNQVELIELCENKFKSQLDHYKYSDRYEKSEAFYRSECLWFLMLLDKQIGNKNNLFRNDISLGDIALFPFIRQFAFVNKQYFDSMKFDALKKWLERHIHSDLFQRIMKKNTLWSEP